MKMQCFFFPPRHKPGLRPGADDEEWSGTKKDVEEKPERADLIFYKKKSRFVNFPIK